MACVECECHLENVPVDSMGDFVCPKFSVRDMIKMYEDGKKSPCSSREKSTTPSSERLNFDYLVSESTTGIETNHHQEHEKICEQFGSRGNCKNVRNEKKYRSKTRVLPTRKGIRIITDVYVKPK